MKFILTEKGKIMQSQLLLGEKLVFTKAEAGGEYSSVPSKLLSVQNKKQNAQIESVEADGAKVVISLLLTNVDVSEEYVMKQLGIYAKTENSQEEILFIVGQDSYGEIVPANTERIVTYHHRISMVQSNAYAVEVVINSGDLVSKEYLQENLGKLIEYGDLISD